MAKYIDADWLKHYVLNSDALLMPQTERAKFARLLDAAPGLDVVKSNHNEEHSSHEEHSSQETSTFVPWSVRAI